MKCTWLHRGRVDQLFFDDVAVAFAEQPIRPGMSGTAVTTGGTLTGLVMGGSKVLLSERDGVAVEDVKSNAVICPMTKIINKLTEEYPELAGLKLLE